MFIASSNSLLKHEEKELPHIHCAATAAAAALVKRTYELANRDGNLQRTQRAH